MNQEVSRESKNPFTFKKTEEVDLHRTAEFNIPEGKKHSIDFAGIISELAVNSENVLRNSSRVKLREQISSNLLTLTGGDPLINLKKIRIKDYIGPEKKFRIKRSETPRNTAPSKLSDMAESITCLKKVESFKNFKIKQSSYYQAERGSTVKGRGTFSAPKSTVCFKFPSPSTPSLESQRTISTNFATPTKVKVAPRPTRLPSFQSSEMDAWFEGSTDSHPGHLFKLATPIDGSEIYRRVTPAFGTQGTKKPRIFKRQLEMANRLFNI